MFIANISSSLLPSQKANSIQVMRMSDAFAKLGHSVILFGRKPYGATYQTTYDDLKTYYGTKSDFDIKLIDCKTNTRFWTGVEYGIKVYKAVKKLSKVPDLFYGRNLYGLIACLKFNRPVIYESHVAPAVGRKKLEKLLFSHHSFAGLVVISKALGDYYKENFEIFKQFPHKLIVCNDGSDDLGINFTVACDKSAFSAGYAGSLFPGKGIEIVAKLAEAMPDVKFIVAGGEDKQIEEKKKRWPFPNLEFRGFIKPSKISDFYKECDVLLAPYQKKVYSDDKELRDLSCWMSPLKIFEYMASKRPMIVSSLPCFDDYLKEGETALLVSSDDLNQWHNAIEKLKSDVELRQKLAENSYNEFQTCFSWKRRAETILTSLAKTENCKTEKPVIVHIVGDLNVGGAERTIVNLLSALKGKEYEHRVITLFEEGTLADNLKKAGIKVNCVHFSKSLSGFGNIKHLKQLIKCIKLQNPILIQTWMYHSNNILNLLNGFFCKIPIVNNIRHNDPYIGSWKTIVSAKVGAWLTQITRNQTIYCSEVAKRNHLAIGYKYDNAVVISNGFPDKACEKATAKGFLRKFLNIDKENRIVIVVGRYCLEKDYKNFAKAAGYVVKRFPQITFVMCGKNIDSNNLELTKMLSDYNIADYCRLLGQRSDIETLMCGADLLVSASMTEAFPNVIAEAMNVGTPCVATDVGETRNIIGDAGLIVAAKDSEALGSAVLSLLNNQTELDELGRKSKLRILNKYSILATANSYLSFWDTIINKKTE